jgi:hypothetical protein
MRLPDPIYKSIPVIYVATGIAALVAIETPFSLISAALFISASLMVWKMRKDYRQQ